ncbi:MAG: beta-galactosidase, partial [Cetobacterium sp.]
DKLYENEIYFMLSTPSGARPAWMSELYPEVLRVNPSRNRNLHGERHNHCYTSPIYRKKVKEINTKLANRYSNHPGIIGWHISNEYGGECHCELCQEAFRDWLKDKYKTLDNLNDSWWTSFWSHTYTDWSQIQSPAPHGEMCTHALNLDWKRFVTDQTVDFYIKEIKPLKEINPKLKATTNFMELYDGLNYWKFKDVVDVVSWDNYPTWHDEHGDEYIAAKTAFIHDINRSILGGRPFMLMESTPSSTNWQDLSKLKKPNMHILSSMQAVAHGSDTVQYFQWRKSRGSSEKFHGAVVDHCGHENTRVFREVSKLGNILDKMDEIIGTTVEPEVAIIFDWENRWAINDSQGPRNCGIKYEETVIDSYIPFWKKGVPVDVISMDCDFSKYKLIVAPMLYMIKEGVAQRLEKFVADGGILISTYLSGITDENDLCFLGGFPGPLRNLLGIWVEEIDGLYDSEYNHALFEKDNKLNLQGRYKIGDLCEIIECERAKVLARYEDDFYKGKP